MTQQYYSQALMEVLNEGIEQGIEAGRVDGLRVSLRTCLEALGYVPSAQELQRIQDETDPLVLPSWLKKAVVMEPGQSIFDPH